MAWRLYAAFAGVTILRWDLAIDVLSAAFDYGRPGRAATRSRLMGTSIQSIEEVFIIKKYLHVNDKFKIG